MLPALTLIMATSSTFGYFWSLYLVKKKHSFRWILDRKSQYPAAGLRSPGANMRAWGHFQRNTSEGFNSFVVPQALIHRLKNAISSSQALDAILIANCKPLAHVGHFGSLPSSEQVSRDLSTKVCGTPRAGEETKTWPFLLLMQFWNPRRRDSVQEQWDTITWVMHPCHQIKFIPLLGYLMLHTSYKQFYTYTVVCPSVLPLYNSRHFQPQSRQN